MCVCVREREREREGERKRERRCCLCAVTLYKSVWTEGDLFRIDRFVSAQDVRIERGEVDVQCVFAVALCDAVRKCIVYACARARVRACARVSANARVCTCRPHVCVSRAHAHRACMPVHEYVWVCARNLSLSRLINSQSSHSGS